MLRLDLNETLACTIALKGFHRLFTSLSISMKFLKLIKMVTALPMKLRYAPI
jgi:hypothetical protein